MSGRTQGERKLSSPARPAMRSETPLLPSTLMESDELVDELRHQEVRRDEPGDRRELHDVGADDPLLLEDPVQKPQCRIPGPTPGLRRAGGRHVRGVEVVDVDGDVDV